MADKVEQGAQVSIHYTLRADDQVIESSNGQPPLTYTHGEGQIVPGLETALDGLAIGARKQVTLPPAAAYGEHDQEAVREIPKTSFVDAERLSLGDRVAGQADGREFQATVTDVAEESVTLDFNHPLAGKTLEFEVEVVEVK